MASAKASGVNTKVAKKAYNDAKKHLANLDAILKTLQTDVEAMNKNTWYGGSKANTWYSNMDKTLVGVTTFSSGVNQFQNELYKIFAQASANGIKFE